MDFFVSNVCTMLNGLPPANDRNQYDFDKDLWPKPTSFPKIPEDLSEPEEKDEESRLQPKLSTLQAYAANASTPFPLGDTVNTVAPNEPQTSKKNEHKKRRKKKAKDIVASLVCPSVLEDEKRKQKQQEHQQAGLPSSTQPPSIETSTDTTMPSASITTPELHGQKEIDHQQQGKSELQSTPEQPSCDLASTTYANAASSIEVVIASPVTASTSNKLPSTRESVSKNGTVGAVLEEKECPLCFGVMTIADQMYALHCKSKACSFNFCLACLHRMCIAEQDDYQLASDGTHQVKVSVQCPQCRSKYASSHYPTHQIIESVVKLRTAAKVEPTLSGLSSSYSIGDSDHPAGIVTESSEHRELCLSSEDLNRKRAFLKNTSYSDLQLAYQCLVDYQTEVQKASSCSSVLLSSSSLGTDDSFSPGVPPLDWNLWKKVLLNHEEDDENNGNSVIRSNTTISSLSSAISSLTHQRFASAATPTTTANPSLVRSATTPSSASPNGHRDRDGNGRQQRRMSDPIFRMMSDPTLLQGLEDFVASSEDKEYITELMLSGQPNLLAQAARLLRIVTFAPNSSSISSSTINNDASQQLLQQQYKPLSSQSLLYTIVSRRQVHDVSMLRRRFPLPEHMPRCVKWPIYDPADRSKNKSTETPSLKFQKYDPKLQNYQSTAIASVKGLAGQVGLRVGDVVTHVFKERKERVYTAPAFYKAMRKHYERLQERLEQEKGVLTSTDTMERATTDIPGGDIMHEHVDYDSVLIVVNANDATAKKLKQRALQMQKEGFLDVAATEAYEFL